MAVEKLSQIASGGAFVPATDVFVTVRSGTIDLLTTFSTGMVVGSGGFTTAGGTFVQYTINTNNFAELSIQNLNSTAGSSSDYVATADDGSDTTHYADFGINNSGGGATPFTSAHAVYLYSVDNELDIGALGVSGVINFYTTGGTVSPVFAGSFDATQNFNITTNKQINFATSSSSFAIFSDASSMYYRSTNNHYFRSGTSGSTDLGHFSTQGLIINSPTPTSTQAALWLQGAILTAAGGTNNLPTVFVQPTAATAANNWNTNGTIYAANLSSGGTSDFINFKINGATTSAFTMNSGGGMFSNAATVTSAGSAGTNGPTLAMVFAGYGIGVNSNGETVAILNSTAQARIGNGATIMSTSSYQWANTTNVGLNATSDTFISRKGAANILFGRADAAAPVAQTLSVQSVVAGTSNTSGVNTTIVGSLSTGSGTSGDIILQTGGTGAGATVQNTATTALTIKGATQAVFFAGIPRFNGTNSTGAGSALLGTNCPAVSVTAPTTWISVTTAAGGAGFIPVWV